MKDIIRWLETKLFRSKIINPPINLKSAKPDKTELDLPKEMQDLVSDTSMPDIYTDKHVPDRKFLDPSSQDADKTTGINPDDAAKTHKK